MFDFSFGELTLIALVAFLVVGPKDFPILMHKLGRWLGKCRNLSREFTSGFESALHESHPLKSVTEDLHAIHQEIAYIRDDKGKLQPAYDVTELMHSLQVHPPRE
jgi:sec-independent protein translocase protein TatB